MKRNPASNFTTHQHSDEMDEHETVLVMQAGGSLGAYECGVYKTLARHNIWFDIIAGSSIGAVNSAIIVASLRGQEIENPDISSISSRRHEAIIESARTLENFWLNSADNRTPGFLPSKVRSFLSAMNTFIFGHPNALVPIWFYPGGLFLNNAFTSPYLYDTSKFSKVLSSSVNFNSLRKKENNYVSNLYNSFFPRLILVCTDIQKAERVIFDTDNMDVTADHIAACIAYPFYGLDWVKIDDRYLWDGSLLGNAPLRAVIKSCPFKQKRVIVTETFPRRLEKKLPTNFAEAWHRARDILFADKTGYELDESNRKKEIFSVTDEMCTILSSMKIEDEKLRNKVREIKKNYDNIATRRGDVIDELVSIRRKEDEKSQSFLLEDWDFSSATIKQLISQGEQDAENELSLKKNR